MMMLVAAVCLALLASPVDAARKELNLSVGESVVFKGRNITLMAANVDSFLLCMNGKKVVVEDDRNFERVVFDVRQKTASFARFEVIVPDDGKGCEDCDNQACFQSYRAGCYTDVGCDDKDACTLDTCEQGACQYRANEDCKVSPGLQQVVTPSTLPVPPVPALPRNPAVGNVAAVESDGGNYAYRAATLILGGFLVVLILIAAAVVKKKDYESWKKKQKHY